MSGDNRNSYCDTIDLNDGPYDVKRSKLIEYNGYTYYHFNTRNKDKDDDKEAIQWYYFVALNDDDSIRYLWKVPGEIVENNNFNVWLNSWCRSRFTVENMKEYDITDKL